MSLGLLSNAIRELRSDRIPVLARTTPRLRNINIETAYACNMNCRICTRGDRQRRPFMDIGLFRNIVRQLKAMRYPGNIFIHYAGEPLLHPRFREIAEILLAEGFAPRVNLYSNGLLLNEDNVRMLRDHGIRILNVSIDGDAAYADRYRSQGSYGQVMHNLERIAACHGDYFDVTVQTVLYRQDKETLARLLDDASPVARKLRLTPGFDQATMTLNPSPFGRTYPHVDLRAVTCPVPWSVMTVLSDGTCQACCFELGAGKKVDGVDLNKQSLEDAFFGEHYGALRRAFLERRFDDGFASCQTCRAWKVGRVNLFRLRVRKLSHRYVVVTNGYTDKYFFTGGGRK